MMKVVSLLVAICMMSLSNPISADEVTDNIDSSVLDGLRGARPDLQFGTPKPAAVEGYYEVTIAGGAQTIYVSEDGKHFFSGELYFAEPGRFINATEMARTKQRLEVLAAIPQEEIIIFAPEGETKGVLTVFTDVTCGYCRKLHDQMAEMNALGIEVHYLAFPRSGVQRDGAYTREFEETVKPWCADDAKAVMTALKSGQYVDQDICESSPVEEQYRIGQSFGVTGTPAVILPDGSLLPGYRSAEDYARILGIDIDS